MDELDFDRIFLQTYEMLSDKAERLPYRVMAGKGFIRGVLKNIYGDNYSYKNIIEFYRNHWVSPSMFEF